jgi:2,3-bisphosphoglycerate-independent phosphoglycerate mutase
MKHALILPDAAADEPLRELNGQTALQAAHTPNMDWIAANGRIGTARTVPDGFLPASDVATLSVVGYDPAEYYTGRAPIEAAAQELPVGPRDIVFRCNLTTILDDVMVDFSSGHISQHEAEALIRDLNSALADDRIRFHPGMMYRHLMVLKEAAGFEADCTPPHDIPNQPIAGHLPRGPDADVVRELMSRARKVLEHHDVNQKRRDQGKLPATSIWLWGQGGLPNLPSFESRFGLRGACVAAVDLIRGIAKLVGWPLLAVDGATGYLDTNYKGKGQRTVEALDDFDLVCVHIEAPDEAGHNGDAAAKVQAIEQIDEHIVGPILQVLRGLDGWKCLVIPDHPTPVARRTHTATPPPFCMAGSSIEPDAHLEFCEISAETSKLHLATGHELMDYFLRL